MLSRIYEEDPNLKAVQQVVDVLRGGGMIVNPTDTVYGVGCNTRHHRSREAIWELKSMKPERANVSIVCYDHTATAQYTSPFDTTTFRVLKKALPGPFTFVFNASGQVRKLLSSKKKTVGIRVPDNNIAREIVRVLGNPIVSASIHDEDEIIEYSTDPELIHEKYKDLVDLVIDGGYGGNVASTVVDLTSGDFEIIREGKGDLSLIL